MGVNIKVMKTPKDLKSVSQEKHGQHSRIFSHGHRDSLLFSHSLLGAFGEIAKSYFRLIDSEVEHWDHWKCEGQIIFCMRILSLFILTFPWGLFRSWLVVLVVLQKEATLSSPLGPSPFGHPKPSKFRHASQPWMSSSCSSCANFRPNCALEFWSSRAVNHPHCWRLAGRLDHKTKASLFGCLARTLRIDGFWAKNYVWLRNSKHLCNILHV